MKEPMLVHNVYFTLKDSSDKAIENLIDECHTYLSDLPGLVDFSAGRLVPENNREVNVTDFHIGLHVIFSGKSFHDQYQDAKEHNIFVERNKDNWTQVRVFDTYI